MGNTNTTLSPKSIGPATISCALLVIMTVGMPAHTLWAGTPSTAPIFKQDQADYQNAVWQYSVPVGNDPYRRAYLWIPQKCKRVRGLIIGIQNMLEQPMFEDPTIRQAASDCGLGIVWITPGDDAGQPPMLHHYDPFTDSTQQILKALNDLAAESGYAEIENAPLIATAHSAATPFVWGIADALPSRMIAIFPYKGWFTGHLTSNIPAFHTGSEYGEVGGVNWGETYLKDRREIERLRNDGPVDDKLIGDFVTIGSGHFEWDPKAASVVAMFIRKVVKARIPADEPMTGPVSLNPIDPKSGWLIDPDKLGTPTCIPVPYSQWTGDPKTGLWYIDREMAQTANDYMVERFAKKPQVIDFTDDAGNPLPLINGGNPNLTANFLPDGVTFKVSATYLNQSPIANLYGGAAVGHSSAPILFKAGSGALRQTGPDTFQVWMWRGGVVQQGSPWDPWVIAYSEGDNEYRRADRPGHPWVVADNKAGTPQTVTFPKIDDLSIDSHGRVKNITLHASSGSGLPVQFYVVSGPVVLKDDNTTLQFLPIPPRTKFPMRVVVGAYQWGKVTDPKVQSALPVIQEFYIQKTVK